MKKVGIVMGSDSDLPVIEKATDMLKKLGMRFVCGKIEIFRSALCIETESYRNSLK